MVNGSGSDVGASEGFETSPIFCAASSSRTWIAPDGPALSITRSLMWLLGASTPIPTLQANRAIHREAISVLPTKHVLGINTFQQVSVLKTGKARAIRFSTIEALCQALACTPGDLLEYQP